MYTTYVQVSTYGQAIKNPLRYNSIRHFEVTDQKCVVGAADAPPAPPADVPVNQEVELMIIMVRLNGRLIK